jgi:hypothetical protein
MRNVAFITRSFDEFNHCDLWLFWESDRLIAPSQNNPPEITINSH